MLRYILYLIVAISGIVFIATTINVYLIQKESGTSLTESIGIHLVGKARRVGFDDQTVRTGGALTYNIIPAPPVSLGTDTTVTFESIQGHFSVPLELTITTPPDSGLTMTPTTFQMSYDPSEQRFFEHPPLILSSNSAGEKRISVEIRELGRDPRAVESRSEFLIIPVHFVEITGFFRLSTTVIEMLKNLSAVIGMPALLLLWLERRQRRKDEAESKRARLIIPRKK